MAGVFALWNQSAIHFHRAGLLVQRQLRQNIHHARFGSNVHLSTVHDDLHATYPSAVHHAPIIAVASVLTLCACGKPAVDTSTPQALLEAVRVAVEDGRPEILPDLVYVPVREVTFEDGVTEASAVEDVRGKLKDTLAQLWRVTTALRDRYPGQVTKEVAAAQQGLIPADFRAAFSRFFIDPLGEIARERSNLTIEDMGDGTAALLWKDEPLWGGALSVQEMPEGWRFVVPVDALRSSEYFPDTRAEWAILASLMLGVENSLTDFERELNAGKFRDLKAASTRVGRLIGESVIAQGIIYAMMKRADAPADQPPK